MLTGSEISKDAGVNLSAFVDSQGMILGRPLGAKDKKKRKRRIVIS